MSNPVGPPNEIDPSNQPTLKVRDSRGKLIYEQNLTQSEFGTFNASFTIPEDASLGTYRISAFSNTAYISVEEYVPAAFKTEVETEKEEYISGDTMVFDVDAAYFFGVPVGGGEVSYSVTSQDYHFDRF